MVAQRNDSAGCVLFIDLNRFKWINDTLGRRIGDELLRQVSLRFRGALREEDIVARLSGDEFVVGLFDIRQHFEATTVAQKLQAVAGGAVHDRRATTCGWAPASASASIRRMATTPKPCCGWPTSRWRAPSRATTTWTTASPSTAST